MNVRIEPFAMLLYRLHRGGESVEHLADSLGIPAERVEQRLRVAALLDERRGTRQSLLALGAELEGATI